MTDQKATNIVWHQGDLTRDERWGALHTTGATLWFTGLSGSGKSTVACALEQALINLGVYCYRLDGDNVRHGLNKNLGFSADDRAENIRRIGEVARLFADAGVVTLTSFISPYIADRDAARALHEKDGVRFIEILVDSPLEVCEGRDVKGLYKKARAGEIKGFTGIDDPYEAPTKPELVLNTADQTVEQSAQQVLDYLEAEKLITIGSPA